MAFNVVYSDKDRIQGAIESGVIPRESLVLTSDDAKRSEILMPLPILPLINLLLVL